MAGLTDCDEQLLVLLVDQRGMVTWRQTVEPGHVEAGELFPRIASL